MTSIIAISSSDPVAMYNDVAGVHRRIINIFSERMNIEIPRIDIDLVEAGILDSLAFVELLMHLEQEFGLTISMDTLEIDSFRSVARITQFLITSLWYGF